MPTCLSVREQVRARENIIQRPSKPTSAEKKEKNRHITRLDHTRLVRPTSQLDYELEISIA